MTCKSPVESPHRWIVVCGSASTGFTFWGPFESVAEASDARDDWIAQGAESAELAKLYDPLDEKSAR